MFKILCRFVYTSCVDYFVMLLCDELHFVYTCMTLCVRVHVAATPAVTAVVLCKCRSSRVSTELLRCKELLVMTEVVPYFFCETVIL